MAACRKREIIPEHSSLAKKAESVIIGTDFDREVKLIGSDALAPVLSFNPDLAVFPSCSLFCLY